MKAFKGFLAVIFALTAFVALFFTALQVSIFNRSYINREMEKLSTAERLGMTDEDLSSLFDETLKYLSDDREDLVIQTVVNGESREAYNEQEKLHMVDVKDLFMAGFSIRRWCAILAVMSLILFLVLGRGNMRAAIRLLAKTTVITWAILLLIIAVLVILLATHFDEGFILFHKIFFDNDLWLMDPATCLMINMVPEEFFFDMAMRIGTFVLTPVLVILIICTLIWKPGRRKESVA